MTNLKRFTSQDQYETYYETREHGMTTVDLVESETHYSADLTTDCHRRGTAINRFFAAVKNIPELASWEESIKECVANGYTADVERVWDDEKHESVSTGNWAFGVEGEQGNWYIFLNVRKSEQTTANRPENMKEVETMTNTMTENQANCKSIAATLESVAEGNAYKCPNCGEIITAEQMDGFGDDESGCIKFECCGAVYYKSDLSEDEIEPHTMFDHFEDCYDIEYRIGSDRQYRSVQIMVACGGPNIYIDTGRGVVALYWWGDTAEYSISRETCAAIDEVFEELFNC